MHDHGGGESRCARGGRTPPTWGSQPILLEELGSSSLHTCACVGVRKDDHLGGKTLDDGEDGRRLLGVGENAAGEEGEEEASERRDLPPSLLCRLLH